MKRGTILLIAGLMAVFLAASAYSAYNQDELKRMMAGEILIKQVTGKNPDGSQNMVWEGRYYIKATRQQIWAIIRDYNKFYEYFPNVISTKIVKQEGEVYWVEYATKVMWVQVKYTLKFTGVEKFKRINFELDKTRKNDIKETYGSWIFEDAPDGSGTIISYTNFTDTGIPAPEEIAKKAMAKSMPNVLGNVRKRVESGGTWKKAQGS